MEENTGVLIANDHEIFVGPGRITASIAAELEGKLNPPMFTKLFQSEGYRF